VRISYLLSQSKCTSRHISASFISSGLNDLLYSAPMQLCVILSFLIAQQMYQHDSILQSGTHLAMCQCIKHRNWCSDKIQDGGIRHIVAFAILNYDAIFWPTTFDGNVEISILKDVSCSGNDHATHFKMATPAIWNVYNRLAYLFIDLHQHWWKCLDVTISTSWLFSNSSLRNHKQ